MRKHGGTPSRHDKQSRWRRTALPVLPGAAFFGGHQSGLAGYKPPPLYKRGASSCTSQRQRQQEPWGASPRPSASTYLPLIERRAEPLGNSNKCYTVRTSPGLRFNASYACTGMHEFGNLLFLTILSQSMQTPLCPQSLTQPGGGTSWAYSPYLPLENVIKWECGTKHQRGGTCFTLVSPLIIVQPCNQSLYAMFALLHG